MTDYTPVGPGFITIGDKTYTAGQRIPGRLLEDWDSQVLQRYQMAGKLRPLADNEKTWDDDKGKEPRSFTAADRDEDVPVPGALSTTAMEVTAPERVEAPEAFSTPAIDTRTAEDVANIESEVDETPSTEKGGVFAPGARSNVQVPVGETAGRDVDASKAENPERRHGPADEDVATLPEDIADMSVRDVKAYVGDHPASAQTALNAERARGGDARSSLVDWLETRVD